MRFVLAAVALIVLPATAWAGDCPEGKNVALGDTTQPSKVQAEQAELDRLASQNGQNGGQGDISDKGFYNHFPH